MPTTVSVKVLTSDGLIKEIDEKVAGFILENSDLLPDEKGVTHLANVNSVILKEIIRWAEQYKGKDKNTETNSNFLEDQDPGTLFELILAAEYLKFRELLDPTCEHVAKMLKGKSPQEIRDTFKITRDFSDIEEAQIRKENEWCEEK